MSEYIKTNNHISTCTANYERLKKILNKFDIKDRKLRCTTKKNIYDVEFSIKKYSQHTWRCDLDFSNLETSLLHTLHFEIGIYHDAELCEVVSMNGYSPSKFPFEKEKIPKSIDEKSQQNRFLAEMLGMILSGNFYEK